jgi:hypothetical protein
MFTNFMTVMFFVNISIHEYKYKVSSADLTLIRYMYYDLLTGWYINNNLTDKKYTGDTIQWTKPIIVTSISIVLYHYTALYSNWYFVEIKLYLITGMKSIKLIPLSWTHLQQNAWKI